MLNPRLSDFLREFHNQLKEGLEKGDSRSPLLTLKVDSIETDTPLDIKLTGDNDRSVYKNIVVKPPLPAFSIRNDHRYSRIKIKWIVKYND